VPDEEEMVSVCAALSGSVPLLQWLADAGFSIPNATVGAAARGGHIAVLDWLCARGHVLGTHDEVVSAAEGGHVDTMAWLVRQGCTATGAAAVAAAKRGHLVALRWLLDAGCPVTDEDVAQAADDAVLRWWVGQRRGWAPRAVARRATVTPDFALARAVAELSDGVVHHSLANVALGYGDIATARLAVQQGCIVTADGIARAGRTGNTASIAYALAHGWCTVDAAVLAAARQTLSDAVAEVFRDAGHEL
jgi:hypothetical protein